VKGKLAAKENERSLMNLLGSPEAVRRFQTAAIEYVRRSPKLLKTDPNSLIMALVAVAQFKFLPSGISGEAFIVPYGDEAKFQMGYQGYVTLFYRAGMKDIKTVLVHKNDHFVYEEGLETKLEHTPTKFGEARGDLIGVYAVATTPNGGKVFKVMSKDDIMAIKAMSKAASKPESPWNSGDPEKWMWRKTCLIQLGKLLPKSAEIHKAIELDYEAEGFERPKLDAGGIAAAPAPHAPEQVEATVLCEKCKQPERFSEDGVDRLCCMEKETTVEA